MKILCLITCIGILLSESACQTAQGQKPFKKVLLVSLDTLRPDFLGCYNSKSGASPNIDRFAHENILFNQVTSQAPSTAISHKSILYSLYPSVHQTTRDHVPIEFIKSPVETLQSNGFKTAAFVGGGELSSKFGFAKGFDTYWEAGKYSSSDSKESLETLETKVAEWLQKNYSEKFFLFVHTYEVNCPTSHRKNLGNELPGGTVGQSILRVNVETISIISGHFRTMMCVS